MLALLRNEFNKYKGSYIGSLSLIGMSCPVFLVMGMFIINHQNMIAQNRYDYENFTVYVAQLFIFLIGPIITSFVASFSIYHEYQHHTMKNLLSSPHSRGSILTAKLIYICSLVILQYALVGALCPLIAALIGVDVSWAAALKQFGNFCLGGAVTLVLVPLMILITIIFKSFVPGMVVTVVGTAANILVLNWQRSYLSPWAVPSDIVLITWHKINMKMLYPSLSFAVYFTLALLLAFVWFVRMDEASA